MGSWTIIVRLLWGRVSERPLPKSHQQLLRRLGARHGRKRDGRFLCEGGRCCQEAFAHCPELLEWVVVAEGCGSLEQPNCPRFTLPRNELQRLVPTENPQGIVAVLRRPEPPALRPPEPFSLILDQVSEPGNLGTILRTSWAFGLKQVICTKGSCDVFSPKAIRAGMGAQFALEICQVASLDAWRDQQPDVPVWITSPRAEVDCFSEDFSLPAAALVIGGEAHGASSVAGASEVTIPMPGMAESLNVAQATTIFLYEALRRGWLAS